MSESSLPPKNHQFPLLRNIRKPNRWRPTSHDSGDISTKGKPTCNVIFFMHVITQQQGPLNQTKNVSFWHSLTRQNVCDAEKDDFLHTDRQQRHREKRRDMNEFQWFQFTATRGQQCMTKSQSNFQAQDSLWIYTAHLKQSFQLLLLCLTGKAYNWTHDT